MSGRVTTDDGIRIESEQISFEEILAGTDAERFLSDGWDVTSLDWAADGLEVRAEREATAEELEPVLVTFHGQSKTADGEIYTVETEDYEVPRIDATDDDGELLPDDSYDSDGLRYHENAPEWVHEWDGPHYVTIRTQ